MLQLTWTSATPPASNHLLAVAVRDEPAAATVDARFGPALRGALTAARFKGKPGESFAFTAAHGDALERIVLLGIADPADASQIRTFAHDAVRQGHAAGVSTVVLDLHTFVGAALPTDAAATARLGDLIAQGCELGGYAYEHYIATDKRARKTVQQVVIVAPETAAGGAYGIARGQITAAGIARARDFVNGPGALVTPTHLAQVATEIAGSLAADHDVSITVLDRDECQRRNMGCFLGVAQGSAEPPQFIHMTYRPRGTSRGRVCLIGKGVTFDSGGYSLKPTDGMLDMKMDMAGAAAVIAAFEAAVQIGVPYEVHSIVAATENMISGSAYRLGDVLTASNGKTVEINNTDAEGRLLLGDGVSWAARELGAHVVIDAATLTGAQLIATGVVHAAVIANDAALEDIAVESGRTSGDLVHPLPFAPELYAHEFRSPIADMRNSVANRNNAQTSCAAQFIHAHLADAPGADRRRWCHIDLAGPAYPKERATGYGVALIAELVRRVAG